MPITAIPATCRSTHLADAGRRRAERNAQTDLPRALRDGVREHAVETERGQRGREHGEHDRGSGEEALHCDNLAELLLHRLKIRDPSPNGRIDASDGIANGLMTSSDGSSLRT